MKQTLEFTSFIDIKTWTDDDKIYSQVSVPGMPTYSQVLNLQEQQIRKQLIQLGWTPPNDTPPANSGKNPFSTISPIRSEPAYASSASRNPPYTKK